MLLISTIEKGKLLSSSSLRNFISIELLKVRRGCEKEFSNTVIFITPVISKCAAVLLKLVSSFLYIRVVNAFRQGLDARYSDHANTSLAEVLRKQTSLSKRLSETSSMEYADNIPDELKLPEIDVERLSSHSHTETAV
uniref:Uncharacterized protein n=1 Tax=Glossina pallidipes TaxID=7398 RepID=A0A1A9ZJU7_GLOPL